MAALRPLWLLVLVLVCCTSGAPSQKKKKPWWAAIEWKAWWESGHKKKPWCTDKMDPGTGSSKVDRWYFNPRFGCTMFVWGGEYRANTTANKTNNFATISQCQADCGSFVTGDDDQGKGEERKGKGTKKWKIEK